MKKVIISVITVCIFWGFLFPCGLALDFSQDAEAIEDAAASVVKLYIFDEKGDGIATGSGFVAIDNQTLITNYHVIEKGKKVKAVSDTGNEYEVSFIYCADKEFDIAILGFDSPTDLNPLPLANENDLKRGEKVVTIGSPIGIRNTVSIGNISAIYEDDGIPWIQFTAPISKGSSGGPLLNDSGAVIGISSAFFVEGQNLNLAIDISVAKAMYNGWNGKINHVGDDITKATFDYSDLNRKATAEDEFFDWTLISTEDIDISIPSHFIAYTLEELKNKPSVLDQYKNTFDWDDDLQNDRICLCFFDQQENGYDFQIDLQETDMPSHHIYSADEIKRLFEARGFDEKDIEYCLLDHSQTIFLAVKTKTEGKHCQWSIYTKENGIQYNIIITSKDNYFSECQEEEILLIIKSINLKKADIQKRKNYIYKIEGDIMNIPSTEYKIAEAGIRITIPNIFSVYYNGLDSDYYLYREKPTHELNVKNYMDEYNISIEMINGNGQYFEGEVQATDESDFSDLTYSELKQYGRSFVNEEEESLELLERVRIIDNPQSPFIRLRCKVYERYHVSYYTIYHNKEYWFDYTNDDDKEITDDTLLMLDNIILSIQFSLNRRK